MRLVAVSVVKNEADIIEPFVRHTRTWVDHHLVFDHDSTDGTREILGALCREGLPLTLFTDDALAHRQEARNHHLVRRAAHDLGADWVLPLDGDEILVGPDRPALEAALAALPPGTPAGVRLLNYFPTSEDAADEPNPVRRLQHAQRGLSQTRKVLVPRALALEDGVRAVKGSHELRRADRPLPDAPLPEDFHYAHLSLRSAPHQVLRVLIHELQRLSHNPAPGGLDVHYRLGFQLLAEDPELFLATAGRPAAGLRWQPIAYRGGPLRYTDGGSGWNRVARALLPFLEKLAVNHRRLLAGERPEPGGDSPPRELPVDQLAAPRVLAAGEPFSGFAALAGWGAAEGPVPEAFLPQFHWGYAPVTRLAVSAERPGPARLTAAVLTYCEDQALRVELNGRPLHELAFTRVNQKENLSLPLPLAAGRNELAFHYRHALVTSYDPRPLAVIFLGLRIAPEAPGTLPPPGPSR